MSNRIGAGSEDVQPGQRLVGTLVLDERGVRRIEPFDAKLDVMPAVTGADDVPVGDLVVVALAAARRGAPRARLVEVLGPVERAGVDVAAIVRHYDIPDGFPGAVERAAAQLPVDPTAAEWAGREDLRGQLVVTIDGARARDFDDAVSIERLPGGVFRLGVHIADVAQYVTVGGVLDREASTRGTSVYYPERAIPMLPERLSNGLCSLRPHATRLTLSAFLDIDRDGRVIARRFAETVIRSVRRMTYEEVARLLEAPREEDAERYGDLLPALREMRHLTEVLLHARARRGSIDFDLPEGDVVLDTDGEMVGILPAERTIAHRLIEEFMIAANEAVAQTLWEQQIPSLDRVHDAPRPERLTELRAQLAPLGITLEGDLESLHPMALQQVLRQVAGRPVEGFITSLVLRTMQRAFYDPECRGHYALATRYYTHFTSPIRRYPDLVVHRRLKAMLRGEAPPRDLAAQLPAVAVHSSETEQRAERSERDLLQWKKVRFLSDRAGERFTGRVTGVLQFGFFVKLDAFNVDGLVPVRTLGDEFYRFEAAEHRLVGDRSGRAIQLGDSVEVELVGADLRRRGLDLRLASLPAAPARPPRPPRPPQKTRTPRRRRA
jgi:ribonuclease R